MFVCRVHLVEMEHAMPLMNVLKEVGSRVENVREVTGCVVYVSFDHLKLCLKRNQKGKTENCFLLC